MAQDAPSVAAEGRPLVDRCRQALDDLESDLKAALGSVELLRRSITTGSSTEADLQAALGSVELLRRSVAAGSSSDPVAPAEPKTPVPEAAAPAEPQQDAPEPARVAARTGASAFEKFWKRAKQDGAGEAAKPEPTEERRGIDLLPQQYLMTVEDKERNVPLVPLHRALLTLAEIEDISLVSCANGTPVVSLRIAGGLDEEKLRDAVSTALDQDCEVIPQDTGRLFLRLTSRTGQGD